MIFRTPIETPRLSLRNESLQDFERFYSMTTDPEVMRYIGDGSVFHWTMDVALGKFTAAVARQDNEEPGNLAVYRKDQALYVGWCGICYSKFLDHIELGYRYCRDSWHMGFATEAAWAIINETFQVTDIDKILACAHPLNVASLRVLEKLGFSYSHPKFSNPAGINLPVYAIDRKTFNG